MPDRKFRDKPCQDHLGQRFPSVKSMCRHYGVNPGTFANRRRKNWTLERALTCPARTGPGQPCVDHKGIEYPSQSAMLKAYGTNYTVYHYRTEIAGWSQEEALETPPGDTDLAGAHACEDHLGNKFPSKKAMCEHWHVSRPVFFSRIRSGKTIQEALAPVGTPKAKNIRPVKDHLGQEFASLDAMCAHWHILKSDYTQNIRNNLDLEHALTMRAGRPERPRDHLGKEYPSINAMCAAWKITKTTLRSRLELGWTLEQILTHPESSRHYIPCTDHLGQRFPTMKAMLDHWGVSYTSYKHRLGRGRSLQEALSPTSLHAQPCRDHKNHEFSCLQAMLEYWLCSTATFRHRRDVNALGLEQALSDMLVQRQPFRYGPEIISQMDGWYLVKDRNFKYLVNKDQLFRMARENMLIQKIRQDDLPKGMRARHVADNWFQVWNTEQTGPAPGLLLDPDDAWLVYCQSSHGMAK